MADQPPTDPADADQELEVLTAFRRSADDRELVLAIARLDPRQRDAVLATVMSFLAGDQD